MEEIQKKIEGLRDQGWTLSAIADELGVARHTAYGWIARGHSPANVKLVSEALDSLLARSGNPPPRRRYPDGHYTQRKKAEQEG